MLSYLLKKIFGSTENSIPEYTNPNRLPDTQESLDLINTKALKNENKDEISRFESKEPGGIDLITIDPEDLNPEIKSAYLAQLAQNPTGLDDVDVLAPGVENSDIARRIPIAFTARYKNVKAIDPVEDYEEDLEKFNG